MWFCRILNAIVWIGRLHAAIDVVSVICCEGTSVGVCRECAAEGAAEEAAVLHLWVCLSFIRGDNRVFRG